MTAIAGRSPADSLEKPLWFSAAFHVALIGSLIVSGFMSHRGENWGGPGGSVTVGLVGSVPGIPMPRPETMTPNRVVDESKGLYKTEPAPEIKEAPPPDAVPITKFKIKPPPRIISRRSKVLENPTPPPPNAV